MAASLTLNTVSGDNKINAAEAKNPVTLSGASTGLPQGTVVNITLDSSPTVVAQGAVQANGSWTALLDASALADGTHTISGNASGVGTTVFQTIKVDTVSPTTIAGIVALDPALTNAQTVHYEVDFTEAVTGVTASSFALFPTGMSGASITGVSTTDNIHYTVTIDTGAGDGIMDIAMDGTGVVDGAGNPLTGQSFRSGVVVNDVSAVRQVAVGDVNNDGLPDIVGVYINGGIRAIAWIKQTDGSFGTQTPLGSVTSGQIGVSLADLNGDGKLDLVGYSSGTGELFALLGNGDGTFKAPSLDVFGSGSRAFAIADINHDGKPDILVAKTNGTVGIFQGNGDGTFGAPSSVPVKSGAIAIAVGDLNGDGRPDIVTANHVNDSLSVAYGNGDGTFQTYVSYGPAGGVGNPGFAEDSTTGFISLGDLNGDGKLDIAVVGEHAVTILLNNGDGTFPANGGTIYDVGDVPVALALADVNGDGKLDLVVKETQQSVAVLLNNGDGTFQQTASYSTAPSNDSGAITLVDMNGDGKPDIVLGNQDENFNSAGEVVLYNGPPNFSGPVYIIGRATTSAPDLVAASDTGRSNTDNDTANTTLTFTGTSDPGVTILLHDSDGTTVIGSGVADSTTGAWSITTTGPLSEGAHTITAQAIGLTGVTGVASAGLVVTIDISPPGTTTPVLDPASDTGSSNSDGLTADNTPTFTGFTEPGSSVILYDTDGTTIIGTGFADTVTGRWSITSSTLADGPHTVSAQATDPAGNIGLPSSGLAISIDTAAGTPTALLHDQRDIGGVTYSTTGAVTATPQDSGDTISYSIDGTTFTSLPPVFAQDGSQDGIETVYVRETEVLSGATSTVPVTFNLHTAAPWVTIKAVNSSPTDAATVHFEVTFSEPVLNVSQSLFSLSGSAVSGATITGFAEVGSNSDDYIVTVATGPNDGTLNLTFDGSSVTDQFGLGLRPTGPMMLSSLNESTANEVFGGASAAADLNGDGIPDLVVVYSDRIDVYFNNGHGVFTAEQPAGAGWTGGPLSVADLDGDGHNDLIFGSGNGFLIEYGNGDGTFRSSRMLHIDGDGPAQTFAVADFNGDGLPDVFTQTTGLDIIYLNDGHGNFNADFSVHVGAALSANDVNRDGRADLVYLNGSSVVVRLGNGDGTFGNEIASTTGETPIGKAVADVNGDRILDVVTSNADGTVTVMLGSASHDGAFAPAHTYNVGAGGGSIAVADFDGNGKLDIAVTDPAGGKTWMLSGNGNGTFANPVALDISGIASNITVADFNGDGGPDIATKVSGSLNVSVLESSKAPVESNPGYQMDVGTPLLSVGTITADDIVNHAEATAGLAIAGTTTAGDGQTVTIDIRDASNHTVHSYTTLVASGAWTVTVPSTDVLADGAYTLDANVSDAFGHAAQTATRPFTVDETLTVSNVVAHIVEGGSASGGISTVTATIAVPSDAVFDPAALSAAGWYFDSGHFYLSETWGDADLDAAAHTLTYSIGYLVEPFSSTDHATDVFTLPLMDTAGNTATMTATFNIDGTDTAPRFAFNYYNTPAWLEGSPAVKLFNGLTATTVEPGQTFTSMTMTVDGVLDGANEQLSIDGSVVSLTGGSSVVTHDNGLAVHVSLSGTLATVSFAGASLTEAEMDTLISGLAYRDASDATTSGYRTVTISQLVDSGSNVAPNANTGATDAVSVVIVTAVNDAPSLSGIATAANYTENAAGVTLSPSALVNDPDPVPYGAPAGNGLLLKATVAITNFQPGDELLVLDTSTNVASTSGFYTGINIKWSYDSSTGILTLTSANQPPTGDTILDFDHVLQNIQFASTSDDPTNGGANATRTITWQVQDAGGTANGGIDLSTIGTAQTTTLTVTATNDAPSANIPPSSYSATEQTTLDVKNSGLSVGDVDGDAGSETVTLSVGEGTLFVTAGTSGAGVSGSSTASVSITGTTAQINALLNTDAASTVSYIDNSDVPAASTTLTLTIHDNGHTGGGDLSSSSSATVNITAVDDAPFLTGLTDTPAFTEKGAPVLLDANQNAGVSDVELDVSSQNYAGATLTIHRDGGQSVDDHFAAAGSLDLADHNGFGENVSLDGGVTFIGKFVDSGNGSIAFTFNAHATATDVGAVMHQIVYSNSSVNPALTVPIDFIFNDGDGLAGGQDQGTGSGVAIATVNVQVTQVDDAPALLNVASTQVYAAGSSGVILSPTLQVTDPDATPPSTLTGIASATISITSGLAAGDQLFVDLPTSGGFFIVDDGAGPVVTNIDIVSNAGGVLTLSGTDTTQHYQDVLDAVAFTSSSADPTSVGTDANRTIAWQVSDGLLTSGAPAPAFNETLLHIETAPKLDLDATGVGTGFTTTFTENGAPLAIVDTDVSVTTGFADLEGATIVLTNAKAGDSLSIAETLPGGITNSIDNSVPGQITVHLDHEASVADYQTALEQFRFVNTSDNPDTTDRDITVQVSGTEADSNVAHATIHVVAVNDPPVNTVPSSLAAVVNAKNAFVGLSVADPDATSLTTQLHVDHGILDVGMFAGGASITGSGTGTVTLTGSIAQIDATLHATNNVVYQSNFIFSGTDHLTMTTSDGGGTGTGGPMSDVDVIAINVVPPPLGGGYLDPNAGFHLL